MKNFETRVVDVTPEIARRWLNDNIKNNRPINASRVAKYVEEIQAGNWMLTGQAIQFDEDGLLIDGQHRLKAVIKSGRTVKMLIARNVPRNAVTVIDTNQARTIAQIQKMTGANSLKSDNRVVTLCGTYYRIIHAKTSKMTTREFDEIYEHNKEAIHTLVNTIKISPMTSKQNPTKSPTNLAVLMAYKCGVPAATLAEFVDIYRTTKTGEERNCWPIKLAIEAKKYTSNVSQGKILEELSERYIYAYVHGLKILPKGGRRYTEHDFD